MREPIRELAELAKKIERGYYLCGLSSKAAANSKAVPRRLQSSIAAAESQCKVIALQIAKIIAELESDHARRQSLLFEKAYSGEG